MTHRTSALRRLFLISCLLMGSITVVIAQQPTSNPIFSPLGQPKNQDNDTNTDATPNSVEQDSQTAIEATQIAEIDEEIEKTEHHVLKRPIELLPDRVHWVDRTYPYGSTQWNTRYVHLGVEFVNPRFTPIFASEAGEVIFAGSDAEFPIGPYEGYYGYAVIIAHDIVSLDGEQIFTLYAHMDRVEVQVGQEVAAGDRIGRVGSSGIAAGPHLHYEVRAGEPFDYHFTRNPELWLQYYVDHGMIAGFIHDEDGNVIEGQRLVVRSETVNREVFTYASTRVNIDPVWKENFTVGDLPVDEYEIVILNAKGLVVYRDRMQVEAYKTTFIDIQIPSEE